MKPAKPVKLVKPMLAVKAEVYDLKSYPYVCSAKLDGLRCIIKDGVALSRTLKPIPNKYIQSVLGRPELNGLDGELIVGEPNSKDVFQKTTSGVMSVDGEPDFKYYVFDMWNHPGDYPSRYDAVESLVNKIGNSNLVTLNPTLIYTPEEFMLFEEEKLAMGYEGVILRMPYTHYKYGRSTLREGGLLKFKRFKDAEAVVVNFEELMHNDNEAVVNALGLTERSSHIGNKRGAGVLGAFVCQDINTGVKFSIGTGFTAEQRKEFWDNRWNLLRKTVKYMFFDYSIKKAPRFPVFLGFRNENDL